MTLRGKTKLERAFAFGSDDLAANRAGSFSPAQRARMRFARLATLCALAAFVAALLATAALSPSR